MSLAIDRCLHLFEKRLHERPDPRGLVLWLGPIRKLFEDLYAAKREVEAQREATKRQTYGQLMLAETDLKQLRAELADSPANASHARQLARIDSILGRIYAAKGIVAALLLTAIVALDFTPQPADTERRRTTRVIRVLRGRVQEIDLV
jgi:hypothetical protein